MSLARTPAVASDPREREAVIALGCTPLLSPAGKRRLRDFFGGAAALLAASPEEISQVEGMTTDRARELLSRMQTVDPAAEMDRVARHGSRILCDTDPEYPDQLRLLADAPLFIQVSGTLDPGDALAVAVVGTRRPTAYGNMAAEHLVRGFRPYGLTTVSGLAAGIDTVVHRTSLDNGMRTIAVLGTGLGHHFPPANRRLQEELIPRNGAVISEYPFRAEATRYTFPQRNRIIAALALGTVVVEADIRSGAIITAKCALDLGRDVFAIPGSIFSRQSRGTNALIANGAHPVTGAEDVVGELAPLAAYVGKRHTVVPPAPPVPLTRRQQDVLDQVRSDPAGMHVDRLQERTGIPVPELMQLLCELEIAGRVRSLPGKMYLSEDERGI
jgi:DNA processing protein